MNPVEIVILSVVLGGFGYSVVNVVKESEQFQFAALSPKPARETGGRMPASVSSDAESEDEAASSRLPSYCDAHPDHIDRSCQPKPTAENADE